ncbi:Hypothetical predicted protein, partial [Podarcis lilfordi]
MTQSFDYFISIGTQMTLVWDTLITPLLLLVFVGGYLGNSTTSAIITTPTAFPADWSGAGGFIYHYREVAPTSE